MNKGYLVYSLGTDTTAIGYYEVQNHQFQFRILSRPNLAVTEMKGSLYPNGELKEASGFSYKPTLAGEGKRIVDYTLYTTEDSTIVKQVREGKENLHQYRGRAMVMNALGSPFLFLLPVLKNYAPSKVGETVESSHFVLQQNRKFTIKRVAANELLAGSNIMGYFKIYLDEKGKLKWIDGIGSSWNVKGEAFDQLDLDDHIKKFTRNEEIEPLKPLNKKDSVILTIHGAELRIDYSRPSKRGREIFGAVVPWDRVWRTGANEPTQLKTSKSIYFNGKELPAGHYSLFTLPSKQGWTLIINKQTNMWGTDHDPSFDIMRLPMQTTSLSTPVEMMIIEMNKVGEQGMLSVSWDSTKAFIPFTVKE